MNTDITEKDLEIEYNNEYYQNYLDPKEGSIISYSRKMIKRGNYFLKRKNYRSNISGHAYIKSHHCCPRSKNRIHSFKKSIKTRKKREFLKLLVIIY